MQVENTPVAIMVFIATIGISLYALYGNQSLYNKMIMHPWSIAHKKKFYLLVTSGLIHADLMHLLFNMFTFYFFAFRLEAIVGSFNFFIIYFGSLILSDLSTVFKQKDNRNYRSLGASGAISGVLFGYILFDPLSSLYMMFLPIPIPAALFAVFYLVYCIIAAKKAQDYINHEAHLWGALAGIVLTIALIPEVVPYFISKIF